MQKELCQLINALKLHLGGENLNQNNNLNYGKIQNYIILNINELNFNIVPIKI